MGDAPFAELRFVPERSTISKREQELEIARQRSHAAKVSHQKRRLKQQASFADYSKSRSHSSSFFFLLTTPPLQSSTTLLKHAPTKSLSNTTAPTRRILAHLTIPPALRKPSFSCSSVSMKLPVPSPTSFRVAIRIHSMPKESPSALESISSSPLSGTPISQESTSPPLPNDPGPSSHPSPPMQRVSISPATAAPPRYGIR